MANTENNKYKYLFDINSPEDLRKLPVEALPDVCNDVREFMIDTITKIGGHFGAGLGVIELTVALHYIYNTPIDKLVFDVGHQGYPHKILTGRRDKLSTIRKKGGLSGFLKPSESIYDAFGAGHASTSISAALGIATARDIKGEDNRVVAIIGDGALTGGLAYEGLNNCGVQKRDITVILNDNNMSINPNVSALSDYFNQLYSYPAVQRLRNNLWDFTNKFDSIGDRLRRAATKIEDGVKAVITPGALFESMGFNYFGPINGNNINKLIRTLQTIRDLKGPVLLHVITRKGSGYEPAENDKKYFHAIGVIDKETGKSTAHAENLPQEYYKIFGKSLIELAEKNDKLVAITAAMADGTGLDILQQKFPDRVIDVGIAEEHAVTFAAGLAMEGCLPIVAIYSSFLQRAYDQIIHDVALQKLHVVFAIDRAGLVGEDGQTHHGLLDLAYLRTVVNMIVSAPKDEQEMRNLLYSAINHYKMPTAIRYPRGRGLGVQIEEYEHIPLGTWERVRDGEDLAILAVGKMVSICEKAADILALEYGISAEVINARFIKPLDNEMLAEVAAKHHSLFTAEDGTVRGGFGTAVLEFLAEQDLKNSCTIFGVPDAIVEHGTQAELFEQVGLDAESLASRIHAELTEKHTKELLMKH